LLVTLALKAKDVADEVITVMNIAIGSMYSSYLVRAEGWCGDHVAFVMHAEALDCFLLIDELFRGVLM
jgi:hypothetical protein